MKTGGWYKTVFGTLEWRPVLVHFLIANNCVAIINEGLWIWLFLRNNPPSRIVNSGYHGGVQSAGETMEVDTDTHLIRVKACFIRHGMLE